MTKEEIRLWVQAIVANTEKAFKKRDKVEFNFYREWLWALTGQLEKNEHRAGRPTLRELCYVFETLKEHLDDIQRGQMPTYRYLLYERFGLGADAYAALQMAGALDVHNALCVGGARLHHEGVLNSFKRAIPGF